MIDERALREEIASGEGSAREFKSSLRWNINAGKNDEKITLDALKAIAGFLNTCDGVLLIGVKDDGALHGIASDGFKNDDQFLVALYNNYVKVALGADAASYVDATAHQLDGMTICRVKVRPSPNPVFLTFAAEKEAFFIRTGPMTTKLPVSKVHIYIKDHWSRAGERSTPRPRVKLAYVPPTSNNGGFHFHNFGDSAAFNVSAEIPLSETQWLVKFGPLAHVERGVPVADLPDCWQNGAHVFNGKYNGDFRNFVKGAYVRRVEELTAAGADPDSVRAYLRRPHVSKFRVTYTDFDSQTKYSTDHVLTYLPSEHLIAIQLDEQP